MPPKFGKLAPKAPPPEEKASPTKAPSKFGGSKFGAKATAPKAPEDDASRRGSVAVAQEEGKAPPPPSVPLGPPLPPATLVSAFVPALPPSSLFPCIPPPPPSSQQMEKWMLKEKIDHLQRENESIAAGSTHLLRVVLSCAPRQVGFKSMRQVRQINIRSIRFGGGASSLGARTG
jgi:hypothetical protein